MAACSAPAPDQQAPTDEPPTAAQVAAGELNDATTAGTVGTDATDDASAEPAPDVAPAKGHKALLLAVSPAQGPTGGLTEVEIAGVGLGITESVYFAESAALEVDVIDDNTLRVVAPPRPPGLVSVTVRLADGLPEKGIDATEITLPLAFRYVADVQLAGVTPKQGPASGGTLVTITGGGFTKSTQFVFGERMAIAPLVIDENTAAVHTPPGSPGRVRVVGANPDGSAFLESAFTYLQPPQIDLVAPASASVAGGQVLGLHGKGLLGAGAIIHVIGGGKESKAALIAAQPDGSGLTFTAPAVPEPGVYGVRYASPQGSDMATSAVVFVGKTPDTDSIQAVAPAEAFANVPRQIAITIVGPVAASATGQLQVLIDGSLADVLDHDVKPGNTSATIRVLTPLASPAGLPQKVSVRVQIGSESIIAKDAFTFLPPIPRIIKVSPAKIAAIGGTKVTLTIGPAPTSLGDLAGVRIGALYATQVTWEHAPGAATAVVHAAAPKGSPGPADIDVIFDQGIVHADSAVQFTSNDPVIAALAPSRGSQAGGTFAQLVGQGLDRADRLFIGQHEVTDWKLVHAGLIELRTPPGDPGPASIEVWFTGGLPKRWLDNAFVYFDPMAGNYGTWGPPIDGAVNVTVLRSNDGAGPLPGATVVVGDDPHTPHRGKTDARGQITFSAKIFKGPIMVSATKAGHTAASVVAVNSENITLRIRKHPVPASGSGAGTPAPEDIFPDGTIEGTVINAAKYLQLPMGDCKKSPIIGGNCAPCSKDAQCTGAKTCELLTDPLSGFNVGGAPGVEPPVEPPFEATLTGKTAQKYCVAACTATTDCPTGFECRATSWQPGNTKYRCTPSIGKAEIRCETSSPSMYGGNPAPGPGASVDKDFHFTINARLGDLSVICRAGYVEAGTGSFVELMMGITPHVTVAPGKTTTGVKVLLSIPLSRRIRLRLDRIPMGDDAIGQRRELDAAIDLDPEGYIPMGSVSTTHLTDTLVMQKQPSSFTGPLAGKTYTIYAGLRQLSGGSPVSLAMTEHVQPDHADHLIFWGKGEPAPGKAAAMSAAVNEMAAGGGNIFAVGDRGYIGVWSGTAFTQQASPTGRDLFTVWAAVGGGEAWSGGEDGTLLRRNGTGWQAVASPTTRAIVAIAGGGSQADGASDVWLLLDDNQLMRRVGDGWLSAPGPLFAPKQSTKWYEPDDDRVRALRRFPSGTLVAVGDKGGIWRATPSASTAKLVWQTLPTTTNYTLRALWGASADDLFVVGDRGFFARFAGGKLTPFAPVTDLPLYAVAGLSDGIHAVGGRGAWVHMDNSGKLIDRSAKASSVDLRGLAEANNGHVAAGQPIVVLGPFLEMPYFQIPQVTDPLGDVVRWTAKPGVTPTLNLFRITNYNYTTMWEVFARGSLTELKLPDFTKFGELNPVPGGQLRLRLWRIYQPGLDIDHFNHKQLSIWTWVSYAYNWMLTEQHHMLEDPQLADQTPKLPSPDLPPEFQP